MPKGKVHLRVVTEPPSDREMWQDLMALSPSRITVREEEFLNNPSLVARLDNLSPSQHKKMARLYVKRIVKGR